LKVRVNSYLLGGNHDTDFLDGFGELVGLDSAVVVKVEVLERLHKDLLLGLSAGGLLGKFVFKFSLEADE